MPQALTAAVMYARLVAKARLRHLQLLVAIADERSIKRGAEDAGISQPAATQALAELERILEAPLFERHAKGMRQTAVGHELIPLVRNMLKTLRDGTDSVVALQEGATGLLRLGAITAVSSSMLGERVLGFCARHPKLRVEIIEGDGAHLLQELLSGSVNLVLGRRPQPMPQGLHFEYLRPDEAIVIAGPGHPLAGHPGLKLDDLMGFAWMRATKGLWVRGIFDDLFERAGKRPQLHQLSVGSLAPLIEILADKHSVALIPASLGVTLCRWKLAVQLDVQLRTARGELGVLCHVEWLEHPLHMEFIDALR